MEHTTFNTALPYGITAAGVALSGAAITLAVSSVALKIIGIFLGIFGTYAFLGVVSCGVKNAGNPKQFQKELDKTVFTAMGTAVVSITEHIARSSLDHLLFRMFMNHAKDHSYRLI